jgi:AcrR family transcriptional regulator
VRYTVTDVEQDTTRPLNLRERQKLSTRQKLIDAAREEFTTRGYTETTVEDIVARIGASRATFYTHFAGKGHILIEIGASHRPGVGEYWRQLDEALASGSPGALRKWFTFILQWFEENTSLVPAWEQAIALEPDLKQRVREIDLHLVDLLPSYLERWPSEQREEARMRIVLLESQLWTFMSRWPITDRSDAEREMIVDVMTDVWYRALQVHQSVTDDDDSES